MHLFCVFVVMLVLAFFGGPAVLNAQTIMAVGSEGELVSLASTPLDPSTGGGACGKYFRFTGVPKDPTKVGIVLFVFTPITVKDNAKDISIPMMGSDKLEIHVVAGKKVPTAKVIRSGGPIYPWIEISISPENFNQAPCLAHSKVIRR